MGDFAVSPMKKNDNYPHCSVCRQNIRLESFDVQCEKHHKKIEYLKSLKVDEFWIDALKCEDDEYYLICVKCWLKYVRCATQTSFIGKSM